MFAALNLQQTLILATPLILTGLAVALRSARACSTSAAKVSTSSARSSAVWVASSLTACPASCTSSSRSSIASLAGAAFASVAGLLKATVGAHEVITRSCSTGSRTGPAATSSGSAALCRTRRPSRCRSLQDIATNTHLHVFWGSPLFQGLHIGFFIAIAALVAYWLILSRTTLGYEVRAVGFNPDAARYGGISVAKNYVTAMAISGLFAGLAGALDILGWRFRLGELDVQISNIGFTGIAVALLGRNTAVGVFFSALLFGGLINGTSGRNLSADVFPPELAGNLTLIIQGLIILFIGADVLVLYLWQKRKKLRRASAAEAVA